MSVSRFALGLLLAIALFNGYDLGSTLFLLPGCAAQRSLAQCEHNPVARYWFEQGRGYEGLFLVKSAAVLSITAFALALERWPRLRLAFLVPMLMQSFAGFVNQVLAVVVR